jgi:hypothetical protein
MARKSKNEPCCTPEAKEASCCKIESLITVDDRGQMVLPKELRDRPNIRAGDKLGPSVGKRMENCAASLGCQHKGFGNKTQMMELGCLSKNRG